MVVSISQIAEDDIIILKTIHAWRRATPENLAKDLGEPYTVHDLTVYLTELEQKKLVNKTQTQPPTYELTPAGLIAIEALPSGAEEVYIPVPQDKCFYFFTGTGPEGFTQTWACDLSEFRDKIKTVDTKSLEFHVLRDDFLNWLKNVLGDAELAREIERIKSMSLQGESLRSQLTRAVESRIQRLTSQRP